MTAAPIVTQTSGHEEQTTVEGRQVGVRSWITPAIVAGVVAFVVSWATRPYLVGVFHDDGVYALLARSIASGTGFHYTNLPGAPAATHYPPLYPVLLGAVWRLGADFPANLGVLLRLNVALAGLQAVGLWLFAVRRLGWSSRAAGVVAVVSSLALPSLALAGALLSETLFLAVLWPVLVQCEQVCERDASWRAAALAGMMIGVLMLVRTHAVALLLAFVFLLVVRRHFVSAAAAFAASVLVQLPWLLWSAVAAPHVQQPLEGSYGSYTGWFVDGVRNGGISFVAATARTNLGELWLFVVDRFAAGFPLPMHWLTVAVVVVAFLAGAVVLASRACVTLLFVVAYFAIVIVWPYTPWRFLWALWPLVLLTGFCGARLIWQMAPRAKLVAAVALTLPAIAMARVELHAYATRGWRAPAAAATQQIIPSVQWVETHTAPSDVILTEGDAAVALQTGRHTAPPVSFTAQEYLHPPDAHEEARRLQAMLVAVPAQWVVLVTPVAIQSAALLSSAHPGLARADAFQGGVAFRVMP